jgi:type VI secretion system protein ImpA
VNLDETGDLAQLEAFQIFGQGSLEQVASPNAQVGKREPRKSDRPPNWIELEELASGLLRKSKDFRVLTHLSAAVLRTRNVAAFTTTLSTASSWLESHWSSVYPLVDEDAILRRNALSAFSDHAAIVDGLRRAVLVAGKLGRFSLRDMEGVPGPDDKPAPSEATIRAAFMDMPVDELRALLASVVAAPDTLEAIVATAQAQAGKDAAPDFKTLTDQLQTMATMLRKRLAEHPDAVAGEGSSDEGTDSSGGQSARVGAIGSRQDAIRALDAVADFFRRSEPSSPVPMVIDRAKRLVSKDFLEVLADIAPAGLSEAKTVGGIRDRVSE